MAHPFREVRIPGETWEPADKKAAAEGLPLHEVITRLLDAWVDGAAASAELELLEWLRDADIAGEGQGAVWALRELRCPDCHHMNHTRGCWRDGCPCDRQGQE